MQIGRYLQWVETAPIPARIEAARALVGIYTAADTPAAGRCDAELALLALMDDGAAAVRQGLAFAAAFSVDLPRPLLVSLAHDHSSVSAPVLRHSALLDDADLVDAAAIGDALAQTAIANRDVVSAPVAAALAEIGHREALVALCDNPQADLLPVAMGRILARFPDDADIRGALLDRDDLDPTIRHQLMVSTADALLGFATSSGWLSTERGERLKRDCLERGTVLMAVEMSRQASAGTRRLAAHLRQSGHLTPALILRSVLSGHAGLLEAALTELSGMAPAQVAGHVRGYAGLGFTSLYGRAGLPSSLLPIFRAALAAFDRTPEVARRAGRVQRPIVTSALQSCRASRHSQTDRAVALLRRLEAEALRDEARDLADAAWEDDDALPALMPWVIGMQALPQLTFEAA